MYLDHFKLQKKPFELAPDPTFLHLSKKHKLGLSLLEYGIFEQSGITVISGEIGSGKTTLVHQLLKNIDQEEYSVGLISNTHKHLGNLSQWIALAFDLAFDDIDEVALYHTIQDYIIQQYAEGKNVLLIVDEAQNLDEEVLEELRLYTNINSHQDCFLKIVLVGQPELKELLSSPKLVQIAQRVSVEYHLKSLNWQETTSYIHHRLNIAGNNTKKLFDELAMVAVFYFSGGIPRLINTLCDYALVYAYASDQGSVTINLVIEAVEGRTIGGVNRYASLNEEIEQARQHIIKHAKVDLKQCIPS